MLVIKGTKEDFFQRICSVFKLLNLKKGIDVLIYTPSEVDRLKEMGNVLIQTVLGEGILLYEQNRPKDHKNDRGLLQNKRL